MRPYMVNVCIKERINDQTTICSGGVTGNTTYLGRKFPVPQTYGNVGSGNEIDKTCDEGRILVPSATSLKMF